MPFSSKGHTPAQVCCADKSIERLWSWSDRGKLKVILDTSPCAWTLRTCREVLSPGNRKLFDALRIVDSVEFARDAVLPRLTIRRKVRCAALHPVCSLVKMNLIAVLREVASKCCEEVFIPVTTGCCGFAGDRGFLHPELTESATRIQAQEILGHACDGHFSSSRTCELGMTRATGHTWRSFWALLDEVSL
jgi:D-lactate dehydrogenase